jgi:hypothetical protein
MLEMSSLIGIPGIWPEGLEDGVAAGAGIACVCVAFPGDGNAVGDGVAAGAGIACVCVVFPGDGEAVGDGDAAGIFIPGI